ncbi:MAG: hypothetical protein J5379_00560 [Clostridiales bacterium]|nr:hypothetical protein [Clostridiales bacterium]
MHASSGMKRKRFIQAGKFNETYKALLMELYVNMYMTNKDIEEKYEFLKRPSMLSETTAKLKSAVGPLDAKKGGEISISRITENQHISNPFFELYKRCDDDDSENYLYVLASFFAANSIADYLAIRMRNFSSDAKAWFDDSKRKDYVLPFFKFYCMKVDCEQEQRKRCQKDDVCELSKYLNLCGSYTDYYSMTSAEVYRFIMKFFSMEDDLYNRLFTSDNKTKRSKLDALVKFGVLKNVGWGIKDYSLEKRNLVELISSVREKEQKDNRSKNMIADLETRFKALLDLYSEIRPLGEIGRDLSDALPIPDYVNPFRFKHRFVINAVNDYVMVDILQAIHYEQAIKIKIVKEKASFILIPLQIRVSAKDGRQYVIGYFVDEHATRAVCLDDIFEVRTGLIVGNTDEDKRRLGSELENAKKLVSHCHTFGFEEFDVGNCSVPGTIPLWRVDINLVFERKEAVESIRKEKWIYIHDRFIRELGKKYAYEEESDKDRISLHTSLLVSDYRDVEIWLRPYLQYAESIRYSPVKQTDGEEKPREKKDFTYQQPVTIEYIFQDDGKGKPVKNAPSSTQLFCPNTGYAYREFEKLLQETVCKRSYDKDKLEKLFAELIEEESSQDDANPKREKNGQKKTNLARERQKEAFDIIYLEPIREFFERFSFALRFGEYRGPIPFRMPIPMSTLERNWLREVLKEKYTPLFLDDVERDTMLDYLKEDEERDVFSFSDIQYCDCAQNEIGIDKVIFRGILKAICFSHKVEYEYTNNKNGKNGGISFLESLYYSNQQDTFRVYAYSFKFGETKKQGMTIARVDLISKLSILDEVISQKEREKYIKVVSDAIQYGNKETYSGEMYKEVKVGLVGMPENERKRFLHEMSSYTVFCKRNRQYKSEKTGNLIAALMRMDTFAIGWNCSFAGKKRTNCNLLRILKKPDEDVLVIASEENRNGEEVDPEVIEIDVPQILANSLPCVNQFQDNWFEYVVTIHYPGNDYNEIVESLYGYKDLFVLETRDVPQALHGDEKRKHSVALELIRREEKMALNRDMSSIIRMDKV